MNTPEQLVTSHTSPQTSFYRPFGLLAELTYRCPLHCPYCSNPTHITTVEPELTTVEWKRVITEASELGVVHILFSGGEPLLRKDLSELVACAHALGMYTNLITSGIGLTRERAILLRETGLDSIQISFQADIASLANTIAGASAHERKLHAAHLVRELDMPLTINIPLHRRNIGRLSSMIAFAESLDPQRLELAHTQYLGWAFTNTKALLPTRQQIDEANHIALTAQERLRGKIEVLYVRPDYYAQRPKPCLHGWGRRFLTINPVGEVLPCQTAQIIPDLEFPSVRQHTLHWIWTDSPAFQLFRGTVWMPEPCKSCPQRERDFGGCRCQSFLLTGDAAQTDPVCSLSPHHHLLTTIVEGVQKNTVGDDQLIFRRNPERYTSSTSGSSKSMPL